MNDVINVYRIDSGYLLMGDRGYTYSNDYIENYLDYMFDYGGCGYDIHSADRVLEVNGSPKLEFRIRRKAADE
jgi:hypothetical protein